MPAFFDHTAVKSALVEKRFLHIPSACSSEKMADLMNWPAINRILRENRLNAPRMRISKNGQIIPEGDYMLRRELRRGYGYWEIIEEKFYGFLRDGATLIIDSIDQLNQPLDDFCGQLEEIFQTSLQVNCYMSWGETRGFDTHWDDHDVMVVQVDGCKNWFVYGETRKYPMYTDIHSRENKAPESPLWNQIIQQGDILFIPRGHWHHAIATGEPSLHLTFGFASITGLQAFDWLKEALATSEIVRQDIPFLGTDVEKRTHAQALKEEILFIIGKTSFEEFESSCKSRRKLRQKFSLPDVVRSPQFFSDDMCIQWNAGEVFGYGIDPDSGNLAFKMAGQKYQFAPISQIFFERVKGGSSIRLGDLCVQLAQTLTPHQTKSLVSDLLSRGLLRTICG